MIRMLTAFALAAGLGLAALSPAGAASTSTVGLPSFRSVAPQQSLAEPVHAGCVRVCTRHRHHVHCRLVCERPRVYIY